DGPERPGVNLDDAAQIYSECIGGITRGSLLGELLEERLKLCVSLGDRNTRPQFERIAVVFVGVVGELEREVDVGFSPAKTWPHNPNDFVGFVNQLNGTAHNVWIACVIALPKRIAENDDSLRILTKGCVGGNQPTAQHSGAAPVIGSFRGDVHPLDIFGKVAIGCGEVPAPHGDDAFERLGLAKQLDFGPVEAGETVVARFVREPNFHHAVSTRIGEGIEQYRVNNTEHGTCGCDAEGERKYGG